MSRQDLFSPKRNAILTPLGSSNFMKMRKEVNICNGKSKSLETTRIFDNTEIQFKSSIETNGLYSYRKLQPYQQNSFRSSSLHSQEKKHSLPKVGLGEKKKMSALQKMFESSSNFGQVKHYLQDPDIFYKEDMKRQNTDEDLLESKVSPLGQSDCEKKMMVDNLSQLKFAKHHKNIKKIEQENTMFHIQDSFYTKLIKSQENFHLLPKKLGIIKEKGAEGIINLNHYCLGDKYAQIFSEGINSIDICNKIQKIDLMDNALTDKGIILVLNSLNQATEELNLSKNIIGVDSVEKLAMILRNYQFSLKKLSLCNTRLNDQLAIRIFEAIKKLQYLDLSNNMITDESSTCLANAISNRFTGVTGEKVAFALKDNTSIKVLDLSNNYLGLQNGERCARSFSSLFGFEESNVLHIDLSNNRWNKDHIEIIQEGINSNKTIYGFHIESQFSRVDEYGFLNVIENQEDSIQKLLTKLKGSEIISFPNNFQGALFNTNSMNSSQQKMQGLLPLPLKSKKFLSSYISGNLQQSVCWICQGWAEQLFVWKSGVSGMAYQGPIYIHMDFDGFKALPLSSDVPGYFYIRRMCPPSQKLLYFFSTPDGDTHAKDQPSVKSKQSFLKNISFGRKLRDITIKFMNFRLVNRHGGSLFSPFFEPIHISVLPREKLQYPEGEEDQQAKPQKIWTKDASVFAKYQQDTTSILEKAMDADWNNSKIPRFVKDPLDRKKLFVRFYTQTNQFIRLFQDLIKPNYEGIKALYKYYSSFSPIGDVWAISKLLFTDIFTKSGLVDNKTLKLADLEIKFISSKTSSKKAKGLIPERGLVRHEFLEGIIRVAEEKYMINGDCDTYTEAVQRLMNDGIQKQIEEIENPAQWRDEKYWNQECDFCYKYYMQILMAIFEQYENTVRTSLPNSKYLNLTEFKKIFTDTTILFDPHANERFINLAFNFSVQTQTDEIYDERILQLHFIEFLEALARAAEKFSLSPYKIKESDEITNENDIPLTWEERFEQPLHTKIENLIKLIFYQALVLEQREQFELSDISIFNQKEINEAMVAPLRQKLNLKNISSGAIILPLMSKIGKNN